MTTYLKCICLKAVNPNFLAPAQELTLGKIYKLTKNSPQQKMLWVENDYGEERPYFVERFVEVSEQEYTKQTIEPLKHRIQTLC